VRVTSNQACAGLTLLAAALYLTSVLDELRGQLIEYDGVREAWRRERRTRRRLALEHTQRLALGALRCPWHLAST
jgi:hypothetical protein